MNRKRKRNYGYVILFLGLWFFWFQNVSASQMLFPFVADDWLSFEGHSFLELQQENGRKNINQTKEKKKDKENVKEAMAVPVKYDNVISAGDRQILYKVVSMECDTDYEGSLAVISAYYDKKTETYPYLNRVPSKECIQAVDDALSGKKRNLPSYILYFRSSAYKKLKGYKKYGQIGDNTYFYKEHDKQQNKK